MPTNPKGIQKSHSGKFWASNSEPTSTRIAHFQPIHSRLCRMPVQRVGLSIDQPGADLQLAAVQLRRNLTHSQNSSNAASCRSIPYRIGTNPTTRNDWPLFVHRKRQSRITGWSMFHHGGDWQFTASSRASETSLTLRRGFHNELSWITQLIVHRVAKLQCTVERSRAKTG